ncbi:MAG TPA: hypothetical protein VFC16_08490 [Nakamurella sp.]|nr:hypothetical protein [Nakamurella sp.]
MTSPGAPHIGSWPIRVDRVVYTTITLMAVLIVYDGWEKRSLAGVVAVIVGPVLAIFLSHIFAAALAHRVTTGKRLSARERRAVLVKESRFLLIAVPPLGVLLVLAAVGVSYARAIQVDVGLGVLSLGFWSGLAGRRAGLTGWAFVVAVLYGLGVGGLMVGLHTVLQPGISILP